MFVLCKVTILALHLGYGGVEKAISSLSNILIDKYDVEIISVYKLYNKPAFYIDDRVKIKYLLDTELSPNKKELKDAIRSKNPIKILNEGMKSVKILKLKSSKMIEAIKKIDSGIVISTRIEHNKLLSEYGNKNLITIAQEHTYHNENEKYIKDLVESCKNIDYFMPVSQMLTDFYKKYFEGTKTNCVFIPHSLDYIPREVSALENKKIISIGRLSPEKGFDDLLDVFKIVNNQKKDWKLDIIGDGVLKDQLINKVMEYSLQDNVTLHGYKDKEFINKQLSNSSIYVMASHEESFGLVLIEAQSFALPCIAFDSAKGACEIIEDKVNGYLIKDRSKKDMADKIIKLIDDIELRRDMGRYSRDNSYKYSKNNISSMWFEFLQCISSKK